MIASPAAGRAQHWPVKLKLWVALAALCASGPATAADAQPAPAPPAVITVSLAGPMVGTSFSVGRQYQTGVAAALEATGGAVLGRPVTVQAHDDACTDVLAASVARKLTETKPAVVIGHSCSAATLAAAPIYADAGILEITPASTNPKITEMGIPTLFRMIGRDDRQGLIAGRRLATQWPGKRIALLSASNAYGRGLTDAALGELRRHGVEPAVHLTFEPSQDSYLPVLDRLQNEKIDVLYLVGGALDCAVILRQARQSGMAFPVLAGDTVVSEVFAQTAGTLAEGVSFTFPPEPMNFPTALAAIAAIRAKGVEPIGYTLLAYAAYEVWKTGVERAGRLDAPAVAAAIRQAPIDTILGVIGFDEKGDITGAGDSFIWYDWRDGKRVRTIN